MLQRRNVLRAWMSAGLLLLALTTLAPWVAIVRAAIVVESSCISLGGGTCTVTPAGSDRALYGFVSSDTASVQTCTSVTFNTIETMTAIPGAVSTGTGQYVQVYVLENPSATSAAFALSGGTCSIGFKGAVALSGVDLSGDPYESVQREENVSNSTSTLPTITSAVEDVVLSMIGLDGTAVGALSRTGITANIQALDNAGGALLSFDRTTGAATVDIGYSWTGNRRHTSVGFNVPAAGAPPPSLRQLTLMGVGEWLR